MNEKGRKRIVISIVLIVIGILVFVASYSDAMNNRTYLYDSVYVVPTYDAVAFIIGVVIAVIGFAILAHLYIKGSGQKTDRNLKYA